MLFILRLTACILMAGVIVVLFGLGQRAVYQKMADNAEAQAALHDPEQADRIEAKLTEHKKVNSSWFTLRYSFQVPGDAAVQGSFERRVSEETYTSLGQQPKTVTVVYLRRNPQFNEVAGDLDRPFYHQNLNMWWHLLFITLVAAELSLLATAWWVCLGSLSGGESVSGSLGCLVGVNLRGDAIERKYKLAPLSVQVPPVGTRVQEIRCQLCDAKVALKVATWFEARSEMVLAVGGVLFAWIMLYAVITAGFLMAGLWLPFGWGLLLFTAIAVVAGGISSLWLIHPGFSVMVQAGNEYEKGHATFDQGSVR